MRRSYGFVTINPAREVSFKRSHREIPYSVNRYILVFSPSTADDARR
jgi:hypothetical protein